MKFLKYTVGFMIGTIWFGLLGLLVLCGFMLGIDTQNPTLILAAAFWIFAGLGIGALYITLDDWDHPYVDLVMRGLTISLAAAFLGAAAAILVGRFFFYGF